MDDEADVGVSVTDGAEDLVEGDDEIIEFAGGFAEPELEGEEGARHGAGDGDALLEDLLAQERVVGDEQGAVAVAHAGAAGEQGVLVADVGVGVDANGGEVEFALGGAFVQGLDVLQDMFEAEAVGRDELFRQGVEHESVVGVGRMTEG